MNIFRLMTKIHHHHGSTQLATHTKMTIYQKRMSYPRDSMSLKLVHVTGWHLKCQKYQSRSRMVQVLTLSMHRCLYLTLWGHTTHHLLKMYPKIQLLGVGDYHPMLRELTNFKQIKRLVWIPKKIIRTPGSGTQMPRGRNRCQSLKSTYYQNILWNIG